MQPRARHLPPMHFSRARLAERSHLGEADFLYTFAADELAERLTFTTRRFSRALYSGPVLGSITSRLSGAVDTLVTAHAAGVPPVDVGADTRMPFLRSFDLALSLNDLHVANDPVTALGELRGTLRPDGLLMAAVPCTGTLHELIDCLVKAEAALSGGAALRVAPFADVRRWGDALQRAGLALPVADEVRLTVRYGSLRGLFADLSTMGMRKVLQTRTPAPRRLFEVAEAHYRSTHADADGRLRVTFAFAFLSGWAPDASQQRPAQRGSATVSLVDALKEPSSGSSA